MNDMVDMSRFIEAKSDQLNADDLIGAPRTITITKVSGNDSDQPVSIHYQGDNGKPFKPCKTIRRVLMGVWGRYANEYVGKSMTLYRDDKVTFGGLETGGIRISHMSHIDKEMMVVVMKSKGKKAGVKILPLKIEREPAATTAHDVRGWIMAAQTLEDLGAVWKRRDVAPFRDELTAVKDARKAALENPETGRADTDHGGQYDGTRSQDLTDALDELQRIFNKPDIDLMVSVLSKSLSDDEGQVLRDAATGRIEILLGEVA